MQMDLSEVVSWAGCLFGLLGSYLLSNNNRASGWGFAAYLVSNLGWMVFAVITNNVPMVIMQLGFTWTSVRGLIKWRVLHIPRWLQRHDRQDFSDPGIHHEVREAPSR